MDFPKFLRVAVVPRAGIFQVNRTNSGKLQVVGGDEREFLELLSKTLKFDYEVIIPDRGAWGDIMNGTWTGVVGMVHRGYADIAIGKTSITYARKTVVDYSQPYDIEHLTFATHNPRHLPKTESFLKPFDATIWSAVLVMFIVFAITFKIILPKKPFQWTIFQLLRYILYQPLDIVTTKSSSSILLFTLLVLVRFIPMYYSTSLLSYLTIPERGQGIEDVTDLGKRIMLGTYKAVTFAGSSHVDTMKSSINDYIRATGEAIGQNDWFVFPDKTSVSNVLKNDDTAVIAPRRFLKRNLNNVHISRDSFVTLTRAIVLKKNFCCSDALNKYLLRICAGGIYWKILNDAMFLEKLSSRAAETFQEDPPVKNLTTEDVAGAFILILTGYALSALVCILEVVIFKIKRRKKKVAEK
ncbi:hypothetical protein JTE90_023631 [Oedothorax gibbosus]|uniref:Ionotropic glutamate receptor L-glutamate and glycine-binding domain-containing protein n=1 Tax=Oedothorax gibbosus TaxID=931172 RepID=A0AAV6U165_9ARAC|nr:hypothetical protein JTE90_023631 [Oedothorax gibbosus]